MKLLKTALRKNMQKLKQKLMRLLKRNLTMRKNSQKLKQKMMRLLKRNLRRIPQPG